MSSMSSSRFLAMERGTLEEEHDLKHFLKLARPEWSTPKRRGNNNISRVLEKLKAIGVSDTETLVDHIYGTSINERLSAKGCVQLSKESIEGIRKQSPFIRTLEASDIPHTRQVGQLAQMPQLLSKKRIAGSGNARESRSQGGGSSASRTGASPRSKADGNEGMQLDPGLYGSPGAEPYRPHLRCTAPKAIAGNPNLSRSATAPGGLRRPGSFAEDSVSAAHWEAEWPQTSEMSPASMRSPMSRRTAGSSRKTTADDTTSPAARSRLKSSDTASMAPTFEEVQRIRSAGAEMRRDARACWSPMYSKSLEEHGEHMLLEQTACDERNRLMRSVKCSGIDGNSMRLFVTDNIKERLNSEQQRDGTMTLTIQQKCMNIKKQITTMANLRRDITNLKSRMQAVNEDEEVGASENTMLADLRGAFN